MVSAAAAAFGGATVATTIASVLEPIGWLAPYAGDLALVVVVLGISYVSVVLGELVPKSLALRGAEKYALILARPLLFVSLLTRALRSLAYLELESRCCARSVIARPSPRPSTRSTKFVSSSMRPRNQGRSMFKREKSRPALSSSSTYGRAT